MKFTILTPALLAALAASANADITYTTNDSTSCFLLSNQFYCEANAAEADCTADAQTYGCAWNADDSECNNDMSPLEADIMKPIMGENGMTDAYTTALADCMPKEDKASCNAVDGCAWFSRDDGEECGLDMAKAKTFMTDQGAPKGVVAFAAYSTFEAASCAAETAQSACDAIAGCEWANDECGITDQKRFDISSETCGSDGDWAGAGAATGLSSGAADSASRFAVLAASAVAAASLLA